jgi:MG2 domain.
VTDSLNIPIPFASVYLSRTTIGTHADSKGDYSLKVPQNGAFELIVSVVGYKSYSQEVHAEGRKIIINAKLFLQSVMLNEVMVSSKEKNRLENYTIFKRMFLGETLNSQSCRIDNPEDLRLYIDKDNGILEGYSLKPLRVINKALGYTVIYDLRDFSYNNNSGVLRFSGNHYFQPLAGTKATNKRWTRNRLSSYYGSRMHFLRTLFTDSMVKEGYKIFEGIDIDTLKNKLMLMTPIQVSDLILSYNRDSIRLYHDKALLIYYRDEHSDLSESLTGFQPREFISKILFTDTVTVFSNSYYGNLYSITWEGEMANERIADMLPFDFQPYTAGTEKPGSDRNISPMEKYLLSMQDSIGDDQVFVQLDRNMYNPGDTIFFQAFVRDRFNGEFKTKSVSLYALLFNEDHRIADSARYKIKNAMSPGWMIIPNDAKPGKYHFTAFTGSMQNYNPSYAFQLDLRVKQVKRETDKVVKEPGKEIITATDSIPGDQFIDVKFLPEGGHLVKGLVQRVGFNAVNIAGEPVYIEGLLKDSSGLTLDTIRSGPYGPGSFNCKSQPGMYVELNAGDVKEKIRSLPQPETTGISLSVNKEGSRRFAVEIQSSDYSGEQVILSGVMNTTQVFSQELVLNKKQRILINTDQLSSGVVQLTLFTINFQPLAERLYYVNPDKNLKLKISLSSSVFRPGEDTDLAISLADGQGQPLEGVFSISVSDSLSGHDPRIFVPGIGYTFNFNPFFPANLPSKVLAQGLENIPDEDRDLLLMVYGWTRFKWDFNKTKSISGDLPDYELLKMKILYSRKKNMSDRRIDLVSLEGPSIKHLMTDIHGEITLPLDSLPDITRSVTMMPDPRNKKRVQGAMLSIPYNQKYCKSSSLQISQPEINEYNYSRPVYYQNLNLGEGMIEIPEVIIKGHLGSEKIYHDKYEEMYQAGEVKSLDYKLLWSSFSMEDAVRRLINPYIMTENFIVLRPPRSFFGGPATALVVLDGMPLYSDGWPTVKSIPPDEVTSLTILVGKQAFTQYGESAGGGVIFVNTRSSDPSLQKLRTVWKLQTSKDKMLLPISIYRQGVEFYSPSKKDIEVDPMIASRSTIFWDPQVYFNGKDPVHLKFTNLKRQGPIIITVNGVSFNNLFGTGKAGYKVFETGGK